MHYAFINLYSFCSQKTAKLLYIDYSTSEVNCMTTGMILILAGILVLMGFGMLAYLAKKRG